MSATMTPRPVRARGAVAPARAPQRPQRPDLRVVEPPRPRPRTGLIVAVVLVLVFTALLASAIFHSVLVTGQQGLDKMDEDIAAEQQAVQEARLKVARYQSPGRIVRLATRELGMVVPDRTTWLQLNQDGTPNATGKTGTGTAASGSADDDTPAGAGTDR